MAKLKTIWQVPLDSWEKVERELEACQTRTTQTLVPTILALGLIAIAGSEEHFGPIAFVCIFGILLSSGLYISSLSWKIFRNAGFLRVFQCQKGESQGEDIPSFEQIFKYFDDCFRKRPERSFWHPFLEPGVLRSETTAAGLIFFILATSFFITVLWFLAMMKIGATDIVADAPQTIRVLAGHRVDFYIWCAGISTVLLFWIGLIILHMRKISDTAISEAWRCAYFRSLALRLR